ncbi:MAG: GTPase HflX [Bacteroidota bacterium]
MVDKNSTEEKYVEKVVLVGIVTQKQSEEKLSEYLDELTFLVETAGAGAVRRFSQKMDKPEPRTFLGSGKIKEIAQYVKDYEIPMVVFDDELTPSQQRNIEEELKCKVLDRTALILAIFAQRAQTAHAKTQVDLAQNQYLLPRLAKMWSHLDRQKGGIGLKGTGEKEIETDRRIVRDKIALLKERLKEIDKQMATQRKNRAELIRVALVGYTNVGKSTIMNMLSKSEVFAENKLFATLDTTVRKVVIDNLPFLLSDTVGFIRKLPTHLVESFKSTLDELREADIIVHVVDISHPSFEDHIRVVNETLANIKAADKKTILVFNKVDAFTFVKKDEDDLSPIKRENMSLPELKRTWMNTLNSPVVFISATEKQNIEELKQTLYNVVKEMHGIRYPYNNFLY